jgi:hypothetical protein
LSEYQKQLNFELDGQLPTDIHLEFLAFAESRGPFEVHRAILRGATIRFVPNVDPLHPQVNGRLFTFDSRSRAMKICAILQAWYISQNVESRVHVEPILDDN